MKRKAVVAMSGGVDSSVAAALMIQEGFDVTGIFLKLWEGPAANNESGCCSVSAADDARRVSQILDIPFYVYNYARVFSDTVVRNFTRSYASGLTPNPCVECNRSVKFNALLQRTVAVGADTLATGHHVRAVGPVGERRLACAKDRDKDQSYVLYMLGQSELSMSRFPVGEHSKEDVRALAQTLGFPNASKPDSQEICFVTDGDVHNFLDSAVPEGSRPGPIVNRAGAKVGVHRGTAHYTVGQRRGLGFAAGVPVFVSEVRAATNTIVINEGAPETSSSLLVKDLRFATKPASSFECLVMTRYRGCKNRATVEWASNDARVSFEEDQPRAAPGQAAVFYDVDEVIGGGIIQAS